MQRFGRSVPMVSGPPVVSTTAVVWGLQPVSYLSLALTLTTGVGLLYYYRHLKEVKLKRNAPSYRCVLPFTCGVALSHLLPPCKLRAPEKLVCWRIPCTAHTHNTLYLFWYPVCNAFPLLPASPSIMRLSGLFPTLFPLQMLLSLALDSKKYTIIDD